MLLYSSAIDVNTVEYLHDSTDDVELPALGQLEQMQGDTSENNHVSRLVQTNSKAESSIENGS